MEIITLGCVQKKKHKNTSCRSSYVRVKAVVPQQGHKLDDLFKMIFTVQLIRDKHFSFACKREECKRGRLVR